MTVTRERTTLIKTLHREALRTHVLDPEEWEGKYAFEVEKGNHHHGYTALIFSTLQVAAIRHFSPRCSLGDIIRYVADLRMLLAEHADMLNPGLAEKTIRSLLGDVTLKETPPFGASPEDIVGTALLLLSSLIAEAGLDESGVDALINEAAENARQSVWSSASAGESAGSPQESGRNAAGATRAGSAEEPSRDADGAWKES